ncbi:hypothetical protein J2S57_006166 [Kineosporia succinea]|uniref:Uncharacterized protein n=1 Tax=Kineosporia succinea TaxID=84632 RepID=A0ABT9PD53_9ACTN|nr:hypothetical protein [Kineosporia succinea]
MPEVTPEIARHRQSRRRRPGAVRGVGPARAGRS